MGETLSLGKSNKDELNICPNSTKSKPSLFPIWKSDLVLNEIVT